MKLKKLPLLSSILLASFLVACGSSDTMEESGEPEKVYGKQTHNTHEHTHKKKEIVAEPVVEEVKEDPMAAFMTMARTYYFDFDSDQLNNESQQILNIVADYMKDSDATFKLNGHADERGTREYNLALSERRAKTVQDYLTVQGVDASMLEVIGYGEEKPANGASTEEAWAENRRVELEMIAPEAPAAEPAAEKVYGKQTHNPHEHSHKKAE